MTMDERFDRIDANIERLSESAAEIRGSVTELRDSVAEIRGSVTELRDSVARLTQFVLDFRTETARRFELIDSRFNLFAASIHNIEARHPAFAEAMLDFGKIVAKLTDDQFANKRAAAELGGRMTSLEEKVSKLLHPAA